MNWFGDPALGLPPVVSGRPLVIGLLNNTSDRALKSTERHFLGMLRAAAPQTEQQIRLFTCPEVVRASCPIGVLGDPYADVRRLFDTRLDALIVTGMEPQAPNLADEPVFRSLGRVADWAEDQGVPVMWSCLAAHAAVLHLDGISRVRLPQKLSGVFEAEVVAGHHPLAAGLPSRLVSPHSRYHGLPEAALLAHGYEVLSRSDDVGVDVFTKRRNAAFVFLQGHPEYDPETLMLEYRRDVRRYLVGSLREYPTAPRQYFVPRIAAALARVRQQTLQGRHDLGTLDEVFGPAGSSAYSGTWGASAQRLFANWLGYVVRGVFTPGLVERGHVPAPRP